MKPRKTALIICGKLSELVMVMFFEKMVNAAYFNIYKGLEGPTGIECEKCKVDYDFESPGFALKVIFLCSK